MWFDYKKSVAPIYQDETYRRMFATASGRRHDKNRKKGEDTGTDEKKRREWLASRWKARWARWKGEDADAGS